MNNSKDCNCDGFGQGRTGFYIIIVLIVICAICCVFRNGKNFVMPKLFGRSPASMTGVL